MLMVTVTKLFKSTGPGLSIISGNLQKCCFPQFIASIGGEIWEVSDSLIQTYLNVFA